MNSGSRSSSSRQIALMSRMLFPCLPLLVVFLLSAGPTMAEAVSDARFVGADACAQCHADQVALWTGSHHDLAMQLANSRTVLGDFRNVSLTHFGVTTTFSQKDGSYSVRTEGPDGKLQDYPVKYTFGVAPLQQYLIEFPGGRLQALSLAWDSRSKGRGGQRWFHLYPDEKIAHDDELHWTKPSQNWNSMCAVCHSTNLQKKYDSPAGNFSTTWSEIDVSCEACHGPGSEHVAWAGKKPGWEKLATSKGLAVILDERRGVLWTMDPKTGSAARSKSRGGAKEIEMCARCHARRSPISLEYVHGEHFMDHYLPRLLDQGMYYPDGQIDDEVYVYGSFLQSKMHQAGVTCSDCHEPHSLALRAPGNGVCLQCHQAEKYDSEKHHFHARDSAGASCAECHMPPRTYMVVDPRHDHSMRIPRPDLSAELGVPNACNNCHRENTPQWAAEKVETWYGKTPVGIHTYATTLHAARDAQPNADDALASLIRDTQKPDIARATALVEMAPRLSARTVDVVAMGLSDDDAMVREAAVRSLEYLSPEIRVRLAFPMLDDPVRAVRIEAARQLASFSTGGLDTEQQAILDRALREFVEAQQAMAERPEAQTNLGNLYSAQGETSKAVSAYEKAIELDSAYTPSYVNMADLYRAQGDEAKAEDVLRRGVLSSPESSDIHHALGLALVRQQRIEKAIGELRLAATLDPDNARFLYVYAVALNSDGKRKEAIIVLQGAHNAHPHDANILTALAAFHRDSGNESAARRYAEILRAFPR